MANEVIGIDFGGASAAIIHQDRLVLAGGGAVPDMLAMSRTGNWIDFRLGVDGDGAPVVGVNPGGTPILADGSTGDEFTTNAADGFWFQQVSGRGNRFHALLQQEGLFVLGDVGESAVPAGPFTPAETQIRENSWYGSDLGRTPVIAGGLVVFLQHGGNDVRAIAWNEVQRKYLAPSLLTLAGAVFEKARDMTFRPSAGRRGDTVYVIDEDGTMAVMLIRIGEEVPAWSRWTTDGRILAGAAPLGNLVLAVERNGQTALEWLRPDGEDARDAQETVELTPAGDGYAATLPAWMEGLTNEALSIVEEGDETLVSRSDTEVFRVRNGALEVETTPGDYVPMTPGPGTLRALVGMPYIRALQTVSFVARKQQGSQTRVRPSRIIDCAVDYVIPANARPGLAGRRDNLRLAEVLIGAGEVSLAIVPKSRRGGRRVVKVKRGRLVTNEIVSFRYSGVLGWRDRIALELEADRHVSIAGISYRAAA